MWKQLGDLIWRVLRLTEDTQSNRAAISTLREDLDRLSAVQDQEAQAWRAAVERLAYELKRAGEREQHEREKMELRLEIERLRAERALPPSRKKKKKKDEEESASDKDETSDESDEV